MTIQPVAQQLQLPQINHEVEKKIDCLKTIESAKIIFINLVGCFAITAAIAMDIGMAAPLSIITGTAVLVSAIALAILDYKNQSILRALANNLDNFPKLDDGKKLEFAKMLMNSWRPEDRVALANNLDKLIPLDDNKKLEFAKMLMNSWRPEDRVALANNLDKFPKLDDNKKLELAGMLMNSERYEYRVALVNNLDKFPLGDGKKLEFAKMLMDSMRDKERVALADNLGKFIPLDDGKKLEFAKMLMDSMRIKYRVALVNNLDKFPTLPLENIKTLIAKMVKYSYDSNFILISNFNSVVKQLNALLNKSADKEKERIVIELKAIQVLIKNATKNTGKLKARVSWKVPDKTFKNIIFECFKSIKKLDIIILSQVKNECLEAKKPADNMLKNLGSICNGIENMCEFGGE